MNRLYFIALAVIVIIYILKSVRDNKLGIKTSFGWIFSSIIMLLLAIFPYSLDWLAQLVGIDYPPALFLTLCIIFLIIIDFNYSKKIAKMEEKITNLAQEMSILKYEKNNDKGDKN